jgi:protein involved in temperature-dependent protein secretion
MQRTVAQAFLRQGLVREAVVAAERAVRLEPADDDLRVELGDLYLRMGMPDQDRAHQQILARQPTHEAASRGVRDVMGVQRSG